MLRIDRCVCMDITFEEIKELAAARGWTFAQVRANTGCGMGCGMCVPYIKETLATGKTEFNEIITKVTIEASSECDMHRPRRRSHQVA
ncbi:MAG: (2Fe-2S)-binding protein [Phycisphaerales bacterium]